MKDRDSFVMLAITTAPQQLCKPMQVRSQHLTILEHGRIQRYAHLGALNQLGRQKGGGSLCAHSLVPVGGALPVGSWREREERGHKTGGARRQHISLAGSYRSSVLSFPSGSRSRDVVESRFVDA